MNNDYPLQFAAQLRQHLRSLRKKRKLTQAQLGALIGVSQVRIAEIEANPGSVSMEQMMQLFAALDVNLFLRETVLEYGKFEDVDVNKQLDKATIASEKIPKALEELEQIANQLKEPEEISQAIKNVNQIPKQLKAHEIRKAIEDANQMVAKSMEKFAKFRDLLAQNKKGEW